MFLLFIDTATLTSGKVTNYIVKQMSICDLNFTPVMQDFSTFQNFPF